MKIGIGFLIYFMFLDSSMNGRFVLIEVKTTGSFDKTNNFLKKMSKFDFDRMLESYGRLGVQELQKATPKRTGTTANSWDYSIEKENGKVSIVWSNNNVENGVNIAVIIQYGHGTRNGGYVQGIDYINPALRSTFDRLSKELWKAVTSS